MKKKPENVSPIKITLKAARVNAQLSREDVAKSCKVKPSTVARWERGDAFPNVKHLNVLLPMLNMDFNNIIFLAK